MKKFSPSQVIDIICRGIQQPPQECVRLDLYERLIPPNARRPKAFLYHFALALGLFTIWREGDLKSADSKLHDLSTFPRVYHIFTATPATDFNSKTPRYDEKPLTIRQPLPTTNKGSEFLQNFSKLSTSCGLSE